MEGEITCLAIGDPHFKVGNINDTNIMTKEILEIAQREKPTFIVCLGDTLDQHERIHVVPLVRATSFLKELSNIAPLYLIIGNHDRPNNSTFLTKDHPFTALEDWDNTVVVDIPKTANIGGYRFDFVPYVYPGRFIEAINRLDKWSESKCIFAHQEFRGVNMGSVISNNGDTWGLNLPLVISGHIHNYQVLQENIIYTGTPLQHDFGDITDKSISLIGFLKDGYSHRRIPLNVPKKLTVNITALDAYNYIPPINVNLRLIILGTVINIKSLTEKGIIKKFTDMGIKVIYNNPKEVNTQIDTISKRKYGQILYSSLDIDSKKIFEELFGKMSSSRISIH